MRLLRKNNFLGLWGCTYYFADTYFTKIYRACTYGEQLLKTLPGSLVYKEVFNKCGLFLEDFRAGEDADWMSRVSLHNIKFESSLEFLVYHKLNKFSFIFLIKKWFKNYAFAANLPIFRPHKDIYTYVLIILIIVFAFNWNNLFAAWNENNYLYFSDITKITSASIFLIYTFFRGVLFPLKKKVSLNFIFPINFIIISLFSFMIDLTKISAFLYQKFFRIKKFIYR